MRRLILFAVAVAATSALVVPASCTFPEVRFDDRSSEASATTDGMIDAAGLEATTRTDATARIPDGGCLAECDCDLDQFLRINCDSGTPSDGRFDCDDWDPLRKPGAQYSTAIPHDGQNPKGDWDCDLKTDKAFAVNLVCGLASCNKKGFISDPGCGEFADYFECQSADFVGCEARLLDSRPQACK